MDFQDSQKGKRRRKILKKRRKTIFFRDGVVFSLGYHPHQEREREGGKTGEEKDKRRKERFFSWPVPHTELLFGGVNVLVN